VPSDEFTDSAIHYSSAGVGRVVDQIGVVIDQLADGIE